MKLKFAVVTQGSKGLEDSVSEVFGRARTFTIVEVEDGRIRGARVMDNPAASFDFGVGPVVAEKLIEEKVDAAIAGEFGPGALTLLGAKNIRAVRVKAGTNVRQAVENSIKELMVR